MSLQSVQLKIMKSHQESPYVTWIIEEKLKKRTQTKLRKRCKSFKGKHSITKHENLFCYISPRLGSCLHILPDDFGTSFSKAQGQQSTKPRERLSHKSPWTSSFHNNIYHHISYQAIIAMDPAIAMLQCFLGHCIIKKNSSCKRIQAMKCSSNRDSTW